ncbi:MAG: pilus assembly protein [Novosphingobium sp.]|nr:pilus assembly protein [Novosphingobium sp.]MCC2098583.1 pilus assembly protein [Hyphomicrobiales bacterium]
MDRIRQARFKLHYIHYRLRREIARIREEKDGVAAVEFALLLPLMLVLYIGTAELTTGLMANRKMTLVARAVSDLIAQESADTGVSTTTLENIFSAAGAIMSPFSTSALEITASSIKFVPKSGASASNPEYRAMTVWSVGNNASATKRRCDPYLGKVPNTTAASADTMPAGLYASGTIIVADVRYVYTPNFGGSFLAWSTTQSSITMRHTTYMKPRTQDEIVYNASPSTIANMTVCDPAPPSSY